MTFALVVLVVSVLVALWMVVAITGLVIWLLPLTILGLLAGWAASRILGVRLALGWTILAGIAGSWVGGLIFGRLLDLPVHGFFNPYQWIASILGAAIVITFVRAVARPSLPGSSPRRLGRL